jgi:hypothetical protein
MTIGRYESGLYSQKLKCKEEYIKAILLSRNAARANTTQREPEFENLQNKTDDTKRKQRNRELEESDSRINEAVPAYGTSTIDETKREQPSYVNNAEDTPKKTDEGSWVRYIFVFMFVVWNVFSANRKKNVIDTDIAGLNAKLTDLDAEARRIRDKIKENETILIKSSEGGDKLKIAALTATKEGLKALLGDLEKKRKLLIEDIKKSQQMEAEKGVKNK